MENVNIPESTTPEAKANDIGGIDRPATLLSWVLVPLMMPLYGILMLFSLSQLAAATIGVKAIISLVIIGINVVLPTMLVCLLKLFGLVKDIGNQQPQRASAALRDHRAGLLRFRMVHGLQRRSVLDRDVLLRRRGCGSRQCHRQLRWKISAHAAGIAGVVALMVRIRMEWMPSDGILAWTVVRCCSPKHPRQRTRMARPPHGRAGDGRIRCRVPVGLPPYDDPNRHFP